MTYQQLDAIADSYIPLLGIISLFWFVKRGVDVGFKEAIVDAGTTLLGLIYIYTLMFIDKYLGAYASIGLDYSTHTALALVFVTTLSFIGKRVMVVTVFSMVIYCLLMLYQDYHSVADILLTSLMTLPVLVWFKFLPQRIKKTNKSI